MASAAILLSIVWASTADGGTIKSIRHSWETREEELSTADIAWSVVRDSRTPNFGFADDPTPRSWHVAISGSRWRVDGEQLTVEGKDLRRRPANTDPARARLEFRQILLEQRLAGHQFIPRREALSVVMNKSVAATTLDFGDLERELSEAAIYGTRPLLLIRPERLSLADRNVRFFDKRYTVAEERTLANSLREFWIDTEHQCRIVRVIERRNRAVISQSDLAYGANGDRAPNSWTVMRFDEDNNVVEFAVAAKVGFQADTASAVDTFTTLRSTATILAERSQKHARFRRACRRVLDSDWSPTAIIVAIFMGSYVSWKLKQGFPAEARIIFVRSLLTALLAVGGIILLRTTPVFEPPIGESQREISEVWMDVQDLRRYGVNTCEWNAFAKTVLPRLDEIARELEECLSRQGAWPLLMGRDRPTILARLDLITVAKHDLPAILRANVLGNDIRDHSVAVHLERVDDHLAGFSSYVVMPRTKAEIAANGITDDGTLICCNIAAGIIVIALILRRVIRLRVQQ